MNVMNCLGAIKPIKRMKESLFLLPDGSAVPDCHSGHVDIKTIINCEDKSHIQVMHEECMTNSFAWQEKCILLAFQHHARYQNPL